MDLNVIGGMLFIMASRIVDVSLGTVRTLMIMRGHKYQAALIGLIEAAIWVIAIRFIMQNLDNLWNVSGYSIGFAAGTVLGISIEEKFGRGFIQMQVVSMHFADKISDKLREARIGVTILPGEGRRGGVAILVLIIRAKRKKEVMKIIDSLDPKAFVTIQNSIPYRGFVHLRK